MGMDETNALMSNVMEEGIPFNVRFGYFLSFMMGLIGAFVGAYGGWLYRGGFFLVLTAFAGFVAFSIITFAFAGPGKYWINQIKVNNAPMEWSRLNVTGLYSFDLYVTVHCVRNLHTDDMFGLTSQNNHYVELKVGRKSDAGRTFCLQMNAVKTTCVQLSGMFEETFRFEIAPTDDTIRLTLYDQDIFQDDVIGTCDLNITEHVLSAGFPQKRNFRLLADAAKKASKDTSNLIGNILLSFTPGENLHAGSQKAIMSKHPLGWERMDRMKKKLETYGTGGNETETHV